ncbi:MAG TPA: sigma-70 family RNA polymerase sigma factor [Ktedonobacteraceae bacterium]|jgi:RNA polymerase sigma-70 factor (ECF subfamily)
MESTLRATGPLGSLGKLSAPARKPRRKKAQVAPGEINVTNEATSSVGTVAEVGSSYTYARAAAGVETLSDVALVELTLEGKQEAFAVLVERYKDAVQNLAYRMLSNITEAEDVTQEVFVRAYTQLATYKPAHKFSTWLLSIASHLAIDQLRRRRFLALPLEDVPFLEWITDLGAGPEQSALAGEQQDEIQAYLQRLHSKYRAVIVLRYWYDFSYEEIAAMLKLTPALVKARLHRARELLARYMKENQAQEGEQADVLARG